MAGLENTYNVTTTIYVEYPADSTLTLDDGYFGLHDGNNGYTSVPMSMNINPGNPATISVFVNGATLLPGTNMSEISGFINYTLDGAYYQEIFNKTFSLPTP